MNLFISVDGNVSRVVHCSNGQYVISAARLGFLHENQKKAELDNVVKQYGIIVDSVFVVK